jgi:hypothetical protein
MSGGVAAPESGCKMVPPCLIVRESCAWAYAAIFFHGSSQALSPGIFRTVIE